MDRIPLVTWGDCPGCAKCGPNDGLVLRKGSWRCTSSYELIFMLVKTMGYWADGEAVKQRGNSGPSDLKKMDQQLDRIGGRAKTLDDPYNKASAATNIGNKRGVGQPGFRNRRSVLDDITQENYKGEHYATFPPDLPRICVQASTSERGCCPKCGSQITRIIQKPKVGTWHDHEENLTQGRRQNGVGSAHQYETGRTIGWKPACDHPEALTGPEPCLVLDPFGGTMTTCLAAMRLGRKAVGVDLSEDYLKQARARLSAQSLPLPLVGIDATP